MGSGSNQAFADLRLRPALDLLARAFHVGLGDSVDLGCWAGAVAPVLRTRWPKARLIGVDAAPEMLAAAAPAGYDALVVADINTLPPEAPPQLIFSNAALHWSPDHDRLIPRLFAALAPGGTLAVQMPAQLGQPSHQTMCATSHNQA